MKYRCNVNKPRGKTTYSPSFASRRKSCPPRLIDVQTLISAREFIESASFYGSRLTGSGGAAHTIQFVSYASGVRKCHEKGVKIIKKSPKNTVGFSLCNHKHRCSKYLSAHCHSTQISKSEENEFEIGC
jgi:hypothetical protein